MACGSVCLPRNGLRAAAAMTLIFLLYEISRMTAAALGYERRRSLPLGGSICVVASSRAAASVQFSGQKNFFDSKKLQNFSYAN